MLEDHFERETGRDRCRQLVGHGIVGIAIFIAFLAVDFSLTPDVYDIALTIRLAIVTPLFVVAAILLSNNPPAILRELIAASSSVIVTIVILALMLLSSVPLRDGQHNSIVLVVLYATMVQRLRFPYSVITCAVIFALYVLALNQLPGYPHGRLVSGNLVLGCTIVLALVAAYAFEREQRRAYLLGLQERLRGARLQSLSERDPLTGLGNRRALEQTVSELATRAPAGEDVAVAIFDIDHFKSYNDEFGHVQGDTCLKRVAGIAQGDLRDGLDRAFRYGGEEFVLVLRGTDLAAGIRIAERQRQLLEAAAIPHPASPSTTVVTASFGVAATKLGDAISLEELIAGADAALYAAKRNGRNQVWPRPRPTSITSLVTAATRFEQGRRQPANRKA